MHAIKKKDGACHGEHSAIPRDLPQSQLRPGPEVRATVREAFTA